MDHGTGRTGWQGLEHFARGMRCRALVLAIVVHMLPVATASAEIIDRVLAVVDGQLVTLSDARAALKFDLVPADVSEDPVWAAMQRLIDRRLMLAEIDRYAFPEPPAEEVDAAMTKIERRFRDVLAFEIALNSTALSRDELRRFLRDTLRIDTYLQQRFSSALQPSDEDVSRFYREHPDRFTVQGALQPLAEVREQVRAAIIEERRDRLAAEWLEGLRRRGSVQVFYMPARG